MTNYFPTDQPVPAGVATQRLVLEPLTPQHVELDYDAVIESRSQLRLWSGSSWPEDGFAVANNLKDLQYHWREHQERIAFTYTVLAPSRQVCLGCVYMRPLSDLVADDAHKLVGIAADETRVRFWVRSSRLDGDLEQHLLQTLIAWYARDWSFSRLLFDTREANGRQTRIFETYPLRQVLTLDMPSRGGKHLYYQV